ncbi:unnamed protein product, partial [Heterotrigona itama]
HKQHGYQSVQQFPYIDTNVVLLNAWQELGYKVVDVNANNQLDQEKKRVTGVEYASGNNRTKLNTVFAKKEIILSAGSINSPKILMLSGIGPEEELEKHGIQVISNLSVGRNVQDHSGMYGPVAALNVTSTSKNISLIEDIFTYEQTHRGPLSAIGTTSVSAFLQTMFQHENGVPDIQVYFPPTNREDFLNNPDECLDAVVESSVSYYDAISIIPVLLSPESRGFILLNESDPVWAPPLIYLGYFSNSSDLDVLAEGVEIVLKLFDTESFKKNDFTLIKKNLCILVDSSNLVKEIIGSV